MPINLIPGYGSSAISVRGMNILCDEKQNITNASALVGIVKERSSTRVVSDPGVIAAVVPINVASSCG